MAGIPQDKNKKKTWRNPKQIIVNQALSEPEDAQRLERLTALLATGVERLLAAPSRNSVSDAVDFKAEVLVNTHTETEPIQTESK